jgi:type III restriction enzyme
MAMKPIRLRDYQRLAVNDMFTKMEKLITMEHKKFLLQAPTGAGKTVIMGEFLKKWVNETGERLSFIWLAPRKLHTQSKEKIENNIEDSVITCSHFEELSNNKIQKNQIYFENWESLHQLNENIIVKKNESGKYLEQIIQNTKKDGQKIVVLIDESHRQTRAEQTTSLLEIINPDLSIEITATPPENIRYDEYTIVQREDVIKEGIIKKNILINPKITDRESLDNKEIIKKGLEKRKKLLELFKKEQTGNEKINPLLLIQIPKSGQNLTDLKSDCEKILKEEGITYENKKLAVYLSDEKKNLNDSNGLEFERKIEDNDNEVQVMIFKEAIALGWDCPRAHILLLFREHSQLVFGLQTIGRIMRMPELKHYDNAELNSAYIYTNLPPFSLEKEYVSGYVSEDLSERDDSIYQNIKLKSIHIKRHREKTRLSRKFNVIFSTNDEIKQRMKLIDLEEQEVKLQIIKDGIIENFDKEGKITSGVAHILSTFDEVDVMFKRNLFEWCGKFAPVDSHGRVRTALYNSMKEIHKMDYQNDEEEIRKILLSEKNLPIVDNCIKIALEKYEQYLTTEESQEKINEYTYEIPEIMEHFGQKEKDDDLNKSIMKPFFKDDVNQIEYTFIKKLNDSNKIKWWYKSKSNEIKYFAVLWKDSVGKNHGFYVDYIVQYEDGMIGLFDTKSGLTLRDPETKLKAEALAVYIKNENKNRKINKLKGGIITNTENDYSGLWKINKEAKQPFDDNKITMWDNLDL